LEYRHSSEKKAEEFMEKLNNKLIIEKENSEVEIIFNKKSIKKINQYYYKIIIK
jgi:phosphotransferase system IIB component